MLTITDTLIAEHRVFTDLFDQIESLLPNLTTPAEVKLLATLVERLLQSHADVEKNLAFAALDHMLNDKRSLDRMHQDHHEIDGSLRRVQAAPNFKEACRLLQKAIAASRVHFQYEEQSVFPQVEQVLHQDALTALGTARLKPRVALAL